MTRFFKNKRNCVGRHIHFHATPSRYLRSWNDTKRAKGRGSTTTTPLVHNNHSDVVSFQTKPGVGNLSFFRSSPKRVQTLLCFAFFSPSTAIPAQHQMMHAHAAVGVFVGFSQNVDFSSCVSATQGLKLPVQDTTTLHQVPLHCEAWWGYLTLPLLAWMQDVALLQPWWVTVGQSHSGLSSSKVKETLCV